ncbi:MULTISPECIES: outer membrane protein assembly factor BamC [unclassified Halomonas]|uniref:outer membrane protein assembly factor BamC n=1 Tax=unclassified Halomonas TaxID=2609666 RepID=UPI0006DB17B7|nr:MULTISPECIES: outer membrane protein assembly factor BamC [unclassified Halomonas]KPQ20921.1 MAG: beta barrel protein translocation lipoprotein component BamC [Halomonas sp. HL-93]SBR46393.1 Beta-barrel assembly machine subunit BamC [Halomonas sp. HL-93]SNY98733.1 Beta-barrel assembly machine subunit BamC [Halomonas sp. hl-4]
MSSVLEKRALKWIPLALVAAVTLAGCARDEGFYHDRNLDYVDAKPASPLVLPDTRNTQRYRDALPVPDVANQSEQDDVAEVQPPQPLGVGSGLSPDYVEVREIGDQRWLVVDAEPSSVWTQLESFAQARGLDVQESRSSEGILVTSQAELRLQSALREGSSEIRCERGGQSMDSCIDALATYLDDRSASSVSSDASSSSLNAQRLEDSDEVALRQQGDDWLVAVSHPVERVWAELNHYLELDFDQEGERDLLASDPDNRSFTVEYMTEKERNRNPLQIVFSADVRRMSQEIRLELQPDGNGSVLRAVNASDRSFSEDDQRELLERVAGYLR